MDEIVGEASGEAAWRTIAAINAFKPGPNGRGIQRNFFRNANTSSTPSRAMESRRFDVFTYPGGEAWDGIRGELWEVSPIRQKLASHTDMVPMLANGSSPTKLTGELLWIGRGTVEEIRLAKVEGKIVVTEGNISSVHGEACLRQGALGVIAISQGRPDSGPLQIPWSGIRRPEEAPHAGYDPGPAGRCRDAGAAASPQVRI